MATAARRVGRPRTREEGPGGYVGFRAPRELKEKLEDAAARNGRSLSTEAQIRLEKSFERQELLAGALELAYGPRLAGILFLLGKTIYEVGPISGYESGESPEAVVNWLDDAFAYDQAKMAACTILDAFRPAGDPNVLQKPGKDIQAARFFALRRALSVLIGLKNPEFLEEVRQKISLERNALLLPFSLLMLQQRSLSAEQEEDVRRLLGPLIERIPEDIGHA